MRDKVLMVGDMILERGGRLDVLRALALYDDGSGYVRISIHQLCAQSRMTPRGVSKALASFRDDDLTLVKRLSPSGRGPAATQTFLINWALIEPVARAVRTARRRILAGAAAALSKRALIGRKLTRESALTLFDTLEGALRKENRTRAAVQIAKARAEFCEALEALDGRQLMHETTSEKTPTENLLETKAPAPSPTDPHATDRIMILAPAPLLSVDALAADLPLSRKSRRALKRDLADAELSIEPYGDSFLLLVTALDKDQARLIGDAWPDELFDAAIARGLTGVRVTSL